MTTSQATEASTTQTASGFRIESFALAAGWTASVLTVVEEARTGPSVAERLPTPREWEPFLNLLIDDPKSLPGYELLKPVDTELGSQG